MELTKDVKEKLQKAQSEEEANKILEEAGVKLTEEEMDQVAGGAHEWYNGGEFGPPRLLLNKPLDHSVEE